jgi:hypothetical protein
MLGATRHTIFSLLFMVAAYQASSAAAGYDNCQDSLPGEEGIPLNTPDAVRVERLKLTASGAIGYLATEYIGAPNLQSSLYLEVRGKYCLAGDLGAFTGFVLEDGKSENGYRDILVLSESGEYQFSRRFEFRDGYYKLQQCNVTDSTTKGRPCSKDEE